jgi:hypothetical protein
LKLAGESTETLPKRGRGRPEFDKFPVVFPVLEVSGIALRFQSDVLSKVIPKNHEQARNFPVNCTT